MQSVWSCCCHLIIACPVVLLMVVNISLLGPYVGNCVVYAGGVVLVCLSYLDTNPGIGLSSFSTGAH